ncbi:phosphomannomutase [Hoeflea marina]|uniref:Phosphomannomutase n=1 Tax=Hoeflea marina TaxID=274592 RepID=A0A317PIQ1_9HYPH|nr:phosphomannomutase [Hoeflea marina]PWW00322.1 phosphomannomutase [Hoeflea marina]
MAAKFGTSGLRGLVGELTDGTAAAHARAFARHLLDNGLVESGATVHVGRDLRPSSPDIAGQCMAALAAEGLVAVDCGALPTPALAHSAMAQGAASLMVTGSHIPADRNGVKFYRPDGEIGKEDEIAIASGAPAFAGEPVDPVAVGGDAPMGEAALQAYRDRYAGFLPAGSLAGVRIGIYEHSSVSRDVLRDILQPTGAELIGLGRSETFVPVDTEAVPDSIRAQIRRWTTEHRLDALISTDGDGDRPLVADETGECLRGDALGLITARHLDADAVVTPVTSNSAIASHAGCRVWRTRVGSPYVIAGIAEAADTGAARIIGFEANGGVLTGSDFQVGKAFLSALPTRDCALPILAVLAAAHQAGKTVSMLVAGLALPVAASGRIENFPTALGQRLVASLATNIAEREAFFAPFGGVRAIDLTDGLRVTLPGGAIVHLRPSGNAPEMRCYTEADSAEEAEALVLSCMARLRDHAGSGND